MKWWSERHVSEDLELSLRLQIAGWRVRYVTYCGDGFQEGVSFTIYDELRRWQRYCYGLVRSISVRLTKGATCISSSERMEGTGAFNASLYCVPQVGHQMRFKIYSHCISGNILYRSVSSLAKYRYCCMCMDLYSDHLSLRRVVPGSHYRQSDTNCFCCDTDISTCPFSLPVLLEDGLFHCCFGGELRFDGNVDSIFRGLKYAPLVGIVVPLTIN